MDPVAEIKKLYYGATKATIRQDVDRAIDLLKSLPNNDERERAAVYMDGLAQMRSEWAAATSGSRPPSSGRPAAALPCCAMLRLMRWLFVVLGGVLIGVGLALHGQVALAMKEVPEPALRESDRAAWVLIVVGGLITVTGPLLRGGRGKGKGGKPASAQVRG